MSIKFGVIFAFSQKLRQILYPTIIISTNITPPEASSGQDLRGFIYLWNRGFVDLLSCGMVELLNRKNSWN